MKRSWPIIFLLFLIGCAVPPNVCIPRGQAVYAVVVHTVDGDTIDVQYQNTIVDRVRLIGVNTPERGQLGFKEATQFTTDMVFGQAVLLWKDVSERDSFNRLLRYVSLVMPEPDDPAGGFLNLALVEAGHAEPADYLPDVACWRTFHFADPTP